MGSNDWSFDLDIQREHDEFQNRLSRLGTVFLSEACLICTLPE